MARIPDKKEQARRFAELSLQDRRAISRAVNRGRPVEKRAHAVHAVGVARRQQRFWRFAWLLGPAIGLIQLPFVELEAALFNIAVGTLVLGGMSAYWHWRARQAEAANLTMVSSGRRGSTASPKPKGHLPGEKRPATPRHGSNEVASPHPDRDAPKPPKPRRKKRK